MSDIANVCQVFDKWFNCLNCRYVTATKPELRPYNANNPDDPRYNWLENIFMACGGLVSGKQRLRPLSVTTKLKNKVMLSYHHNV